MRRILTVTAVAAVLVHSTSSVAQPGALEEVIVTATKRAESLQDIPVTVNALSENTIQEAGITDIGDVAALVPALTVSTNLSPFASALRIRGFGTSQNDPALEASVAFILDGVYMGSSGLGMSDLTDIERIEVLQGPQGTLYGKNSNAGVVSVITKIPNMEETEALSRPAWVTTPCRDMWDPSPGRLLIHWPIACPAAGMRPTAGWRAIPGTTSTQYRTGMHGANSCGCQPTHSACSLRPAHVDRDTNCCGADATQTAAVTDQLVAQGLPVPKNDAFDYKNNVDVDSNFDLESDAVNIKLDYELDTAVLTSLTAWNDYDYKTSTDADRSDLAVLAIVDDKYSGEQYSQELRLTSELDGPLQYMLGAFYAYEERTRGGSGESPVEIGDDVITVGGAATGLGPAFGVLVQPGDTVAFDSKWETQTYALFGQSTYNITEEWAATLGLRYTTETKDADLYTQPFSTAATFGTGGSLVELAFAPVDEDFNRDSDGFTGLANLTWFVQEETMAFASVSTGTKSGGFNGVAGEGAPREFKDEDTTNYELGIKSQLFDNRLRLNASAFYTEFNDLQFLAQQSSGAGTFVSNAAEGTSSGVDLNFSASPWAFLMMSGGLQYLDAKYTDGELDELNLDVPYAPTWSGNVSATFLLPLADGVTYLRGDYSYMGDHFNNPTYQDDKVEQDKNLLNVRLGWRNDNWDAAVWLKNATDESYATLSAAPLAYSGTEAFFLEAPRTYGVTVRYNF